MAEPPVVNASPLIILAQGRRLEMLRLMGDRIVVPRQVAIEVRRRGLGDAGVQALAETTWLEIIETGAVSAAVRHYGLDPGEESVLTWALGHPGTIAILDDRRGRYVARTLGIPFIGTLGLVLEAKRRGVIPAACPMIEHLLRVTDWYLADDVREHALRRVGE